MADFKMNKPVNHFYGAMPKIGIRPTIDGRRRGVRESLEKQTMAMAKSAAKLISSKLRHPNGMPVECVISDVTISGAAEAAICAEKFRRENVTATLSVTPCWCYSAETMDMDPLTQKAIWGFNGTERPGAVYLAAVLAAHSQKGLPAFGIYGHDVQDASDTKIPSDVEEKILRFARAAIAVGTMRGKSYLSIGSVAMGIGGSIVDPAFFEDYLNMRCESVDMTEIIRRVNEGIFDPEEFALARKWVAKYCKQGADVYNGKNGKSASQQKAIWDYCIKMTMIARDLFIGNPKLAELGFGEEAMGHNALAGGFQGQRQWTDHMPNGDFMETIMDTSFDWNGIREAFVLATENDSLNCVAMLFSHLVSCRAAGFSDVRTYWSPAAVKKATGMKLPVPGMMHLINSGATTLDATGRAGKDPEMKYFWELTADDAKACLDATSWVPANLGYFRGGGFSSHFLTRGGMPITMSRVNLVKGLGPVLQIAEGFTYEPPKKIHDILDKRTDPGWPSTWFVPRTTGKGAFADVYSVMANWGANHGAFTYGHIGADLITLASMLRIPVCMHNVDEDKIFRPSAWAAFGMDKEGSDYRACANFGPLYR
ncbi:MAG: L-fucose isomerase [Victivallaceae bacterium]|nr:L-fucose isomerase [Victivallaceae bacterium]